MSTRREKDDAGSDQRQGRVKIRQLPTGVPGLDKILGGGLPEYSFNIIAGAPGSGKTTLAHQDQKPRHGGQALGARTSVTRLYGSAIAVKIQNWRRTRPLGVAAS